MVSLKLAPAATNKALATTTRVSARRSVVTCMAPQQQSADIKIQRRSLAALLAIALPAGNAMALIPDDDDEELIEKARANRKAKLSSERVAEKAYTRSSGYTSGTVKKELVPVQLGINELARTGALLASGDVSGAASALNGSWVSDFSQATDDLSFNDASKSARSSVLSAVSSLQSSASKGSLQDAKKNFVSVVSALQGWAGAADLTTSLKGI